MEGGVVVGVGVGVGNTVMVTVTGGAVTVTVAGVSVVTGAVQPTKSMAAKITDMTKISLITNPVTPPHKKTRYSALTLDLVRVLVNTSPIN